MRRRFQSLITSRGEISDALFRGCREANFASCIDALVETWPNGINCLTAVALSDERIRTAH